MTDHLVDAGTKRRGERGASLPLALGFLVGLGVIVAGLLTYTETGLRNVSSFREQRDERYAVDGALDQAIAWAAEQPRIGVDPDLPDDQRDPCNLAVPAQPAVQGSSEATPEITVTCQAIAGSGSGLPAQAGGTPEYSILTLGQRQNEPPPYAGSSCILDQPRPGWDPTGLRGANRREFGIRMAPTTFLCVSTRTVQNWQVKGTVFSNSPIVGTGGTTIELLDNGTGPGGEPRPPSEVRARGGCLRFTTACTTLPLTNGSPMVPGDLPGDADAEGYDPRIDPTATEAERASWNLPDLSGLPRIPGSAVTAKAADCGSGKTVVFEPGWYDDIEALNGLFRNPACQTTTFWFAPARGDDNQILGPNYRQGLYYFDFTRGDGGGCNFYDAAPSTRHQWCVGDTAAFRQVVVGGTPQSWNPFVDDLDGGPGGEPGEPQIVLGEADVAGILGTSPVWSNTANARTMNGSSATYSTILFANDRPITLQNWSPKLASGAYNGSFNIRVAHRTQGSFNAPRVTVSYDSGLFGAETCGTYTLNKGNFPNTAPDQLSPQDQIALGQCLNHGDKINTVQVRYSVSGCNFFCLESITLDGMELIPGDFPDQPSFPRPPGPTDSGGDCDPDAPGVQFIFGGDSHLYVASGSVELCAGPAAQNPAEGQQIAVYGVPAVEPIRPTSVTASSAAYNDRSVTLGVDDGDNAFRIGEPAGAERGDVASIRYRLEGSDFAGGGQIAGGVNLTFPRLDLTRYGPAGTLEVADIRVRASYNSGGILTGPELDLPGCGRIGFSPSHGIPQIDGNTQQQRNATCVADALTADSITATYWARTTWACVFFICTGTQNDKLDGIEFIVTLRSANPDDPASPVPVPNGGCLIGAPNYWNAAQGGENNCAIVKADQTKAVGGGSDSRGRFSVKGTIYVPSAAIDIDDEDVLYPFFSRGLVARHLMFRGFRYRIPVPLVDIPSIDRRPRPREAVFTACVWNDDATGRPAFDPQCDPTLGDEILGRTRVRYELDDTVEYVDGMWPDVPRVIWWNNER